jgi:hypothetical protein
VLLLDSQRSNMHIDRHPVTGMPLLQRKEKLEKARRENEKTDIFLIMWRKLTSRNESP